MKFVILIIPIFCLVACGVRQTQHANGSKSYDLYTTVNSNTACKNGLGQIVQEATLGVWANGSEAGLGYQSKRFACLKQECQMVIWLEDPDQLASVKELIGDVTNICVIE